MKIPKKFSGWKLSFSEYREQTKRIWFNEPETKLGNTYSKSQARDLIPPAIHLSMGNDQLRWDSLNTASVKFQTSENFYVQLVTE